MASTISPKRIFPTILFCLVLVVNFSSALAVAQRIALEDVPDWIRGRGEQIELRLAGHVTRSDGGSIDGTEVQIQIKYNDRSFDSFEPPVDEGRFEVWLPVNKYSWYSITVSARCSDGARCTRNILRQQLRELVVNGLDLNAQLPERDVSVRVERDGNVVTDASIRAELSSGSTLQLATNANGIATLTMLEDEELVALTAWSPRKLIGGFQFSRKPIRDPRADSHVISIYQCRPFKVHLNDANGQPIAGVDLRLNVATPAPDYNFLGTPDDYKLATNQDGIATFAWYPDLDDAHSYAEILDDRWSIESSQLSKDKLEVIANRAVERKRFTGRVVGGGKFAGGFSIKFGTFQAEQERRIDYAYSFSDANGNFSADVLPDATYAVFLEDGKWVTNAVDLIPFDSKTGQRKHVELPLSEGIPVRITLTQGSDHKPISGAWVNIDSDHNFTWLEDGKPESGSLGRSASTYSNDDGVIEMLAPEGKLEASVYLTDWRATQSIDVRRGESNEVQLHRKVDEAVEVTGKIVPWQEDQQQIASATVHIRAIDGESGDEFRLKTDENGSFRIKTRAAQLGAIAYSPDKRFIGTLVVKEFSEPARIQLYPTKSFAGQITDQNGNPITDHKVWASIKIEDERKFGTAYPTTFYVQRIETQTDSEGNYRFDGLPCQTRILLGTDTLENEPNRFESIDEIYYLPDDTLRSRVTMIGTSTSRDEPLPLAECFASMHRDCRLGSYHLMIIVHDKSDESNREFINKHLLNYSEHKAVASYMQLQVDVKELSAGNNIAFVERFDWPNVTQGIFAVGYDIEGKELGRIHLDPEATDAAEAAYAFIELHAPSRKDAEAKWNKAFQQAKEQNKFVWVRTGQRYCGPCFMLSRWIDDHREVLEKDFILLKIDDFGDLNGQTIAERLTRGRPVGVPFHAMFDANEKPVTDSYGPLGNIGFMSGLEGKRHFKKMLNAACSKITPQEIQVLLDSLED